MRRRLALILLTLISSSRFGLAVAFVCSSDPTTRFWLVVAAAATDFIDGFWARHGHLTTRFGALLDPLADRAFVLTALTVYLSERALAPWAYAVLLIRDVATTVAFLVTRLSKTFRQVQFQARWPGKIVTSVQLLVLLVIPFAAGWIAPLIGLAAAASLWAVVDYARIVWRRRSTRLPNPPLDRLPQAS